MFKNMKKERISTGGGAIAFATAVGVLITFLGTQLLHGQASPLAYTSPVWVNNLTNIWLNGFALPNGLETSVWFEWGTNANYFAASTATSIPSNGGLTRVSMPVPSPLPGRCYDLRVVASNATGVAYGAVNQFTPQSSLKLAWGLNTDTRYANSIRQPVGSVACAAAQTIAVKLDGGVAAWGLSATVTNVPADATNVVSVAAGPGNNVALRQDGSVLVWGNYTSVQTNVPSDLTNAVAVSFSTDHCLALRADGSVVGWGANDFGKATVPNDVSNVVAVAAGAVQSAVLDVYGKVRVWGNSTYTNIPSDWTNMVAIVCNSSRTLALRSDGTVRCWGSNSSGQTNVPANLTNVMAVSAGWHHCLALKQDGTVSAWGWNGGGQTSIPVGLSNVIAIGAGGWHSAALKRDGQVVVWGANGGGGYGSSTLKLIPRDAYNLVGIATSGDHMVALRNSGQVLAWGANLHGELSIPSAVLNSYAIAAPVWNCVALDSKGSPRVWGWNIAGQTNSPAGLSNVVSVVGGWYHLLALTSDGRITAWGTNYYGGYELASTLGTPSTNGPATVPEGLTNVAAIGVGDWSSVAIGPNLPPVAGNLVVTGFVNADLIIQLPSPTDYNGDSFTFRSVQLPGTGSLYQCTNGSPGLPLNPGDVISDSEGRLVFRPGPQDLGLPLTSFNYLANDGTADSLPAAVVVNIVLPAAPVIDASTLNFISQPPNMGFSLRFAGSTNASYRVWATTNLMDWELLGSATVISNGLYEFLDSQAGDLSERFYQVRSP